MDPNTPTEPTDTGTQAQTPPPAEPQGGTKPAEPQTQQQPTPPPNAPTPEETAAAEKAYTDALAAALDGDKENVNIDLVRTIAPELKKYGIDGAKAAELVRFVAKAEAAAAEQSETAWRQQQEAKYQECVSKFGPKDADLVAATLKEVFKDAPDMAETFKHELGSNPAVIRLVLAAGQGLGVTVNGGAGVGNAAAFAERDIASRLFADDFK